jgi:hypothetical protein
MAFDFFSKEPISVQCNYGKTNVAEVWAYIFLCVDTNFLDIILADVY